MSILLDTGATHNFIDPMLLQKIGLSKQMHPQFEDTIAGDSKLRSEGVFKHVMIECQGMKITTHFYCYQLANVKLFWEFSGLRLLKDCFNFKQHKLQIMFQGQSLGIEGYVGPKAFHPSFDDD